MKKLILLLVNTGMITIFILFSIVNNGFCQQTQDTILLPQIKITSLYGFGPYYVGSVQENLFLVDSLPESTNKVTFRFIDSDSIQIGDSHNVEGQSLESAYWYVYLDSLNLPLSPRLHVKVDYGTDSTANYFIAYTVYPDTLEVNASEGWGPFFTNNYNLNDTLWQPVPELNNTFKIKNLPPRTGEVAFYISLLDSTVVDSLHVYAGKNEYLDSASFPNVRMDDLSLYTGFLKIVVKCNGGPDKGWSTFHTLKARPQLPILRVTSDDGITLIDSVKPAFQNQLSGHSLLVDSIKYMATTNFPGGQRYSRQGSYSLDLVNSQYSIEAWIKPDIDMLEFGPLGEMAFMKVDSAWSLSIEGTSSAIRFNLNSLYNDSSINLAYADISYSTMRASEWHHISLVGFDVTDKYFYLNGDLIPTTVNKQSIGYLAGIISDVVKALKTQALLMGGCNSENKKTTSDLTLINAMDEVRIWNKALTAEEISNIYGKTIMQEPELIGYWNFDDLNCEGNVVDDISYRCNNAQLYNGATLIPQYPGIQLSYDKLHFISSNKNTYPVKYYFIDDVNNVIDSGVALPGAGICDIYYDIQALPTNTDILRIDEIVAGSDIAFSTDYKLTILPPKPIATCRTGWGIFYASSEAGIPSICDTGILFNPVSISSLPVNTKKIIAGWEKDGELFDTKSFTSSSPPWENSLTLNGTDNYIQTMFYGVQLQPEFTLTFWFKTNTTKGGIMAGYFSGVSAPSLTEGKSRHLNETYIKMKTDGAIQFILPVGSSTVSLNASNKFNDGKWHHLAACYDASSSSPNTSLYIDGTLTDEADIEMNDLQVCAFYMGKNYESKAGTDAVAEYFQGSFSEVTHWVKMLDYKSINRNMYRTVSPDGFGFHYKLNERQGNIIHNSCYGFFDATLIGSDKMWSYQNEMSCVTWTDNILDYPEGEYNFFVRAYCEASPDTGIYYNPLGRIKIDNPVEGFDVTYNFEQGTGYFDEGTIVKNNFNFWTNYNNPGCSNNIISLYIIDPKGYCLDSLIHFYPHDTTQFSHSIDMGEIITGSYLKLNYGYEDYSANIYIDTFNIIPLFTRSILPPVVSGNFGPFDQAIALGTMAQIDTIFIKTEVYNDLKHVIVSLYAYNGECILDSAATKKTDSTWHFVYNMATLPPPYVDMKIRYYLGDDPDPVVTQGPFHIIIHRTRPRWFDFLPDENFSDIVENGEVVTFKITSPIEDKFEDFISAMSIPSSVPFFGGLSAHIKSAEIDAPLRYVVPDYKLHLNGVTTFKQSFINMGSDAQKVLSINIDTTNNQFYLQPVTNDIIANYNMYWHGKISSKLGKAAEVEERIKSILHIIEELNMESMVTPTFDISYKGNYQFSRRLNLITDSLTGKWGSHGNLKVNANPASPNYNKSASFHFYGGTFGLEFTIGLKVGKGLVEADFSLDASFPIGFGQSYKSIPELETHFLKSFGFQTYGKAVVKIFWGWYEKTIWGPKMFYSTTIWGNDMKECFPAPDKTTEEKPIHIPAQSSWPELAGEIVPVTTFNKIPLSHPQASIVSSDEYNLFTWLERGETYGERSLKARYMKHEDKKFSSISGVETNNHAINSPVSDAINDRNVLICWAQTHYTSETFLQIKPDNALHAFLESQDIWFASYDIETDSLLQMEMITNIPELSASGIAKANPLIACLSENMAIIIWQVADFNSNSSHIWYAILNKDNDLWFISEPAVLHSGSGIQTNLKIASPEEDMAIATWMNSNTSDSTYNKIMAATFDGTEWTETSVLLDEQNHHYNEFSMTLKNDMGGVVLTSYVSVPDSLNYEALLFVPWDANISGLNPGQTQLVLKDTVYHLQYPVLSIHNDGSSCIAVKREEIIPKDALSRISQIDVFNADLNNPVNNWQHLPYSDFVCDTSMQVSDINLTYFGYDSLILLTNEYPLTASNSQFIPKNGILFGDRYMNLVLRSFTIENDSISDIDEEQLFASIDEPIVDIEQPVHLYPNYPNPCRDYTRIGFDIPEKLSVNLELFDLSGVRVATLVNQELNQGQYEIPLNTNVLEPGIYVFILTTKYGKLSSRMVVVR
jgi:hypothetical protein